jgi:hypothetical protein
MGNLPFIAVLVLLVVAIALFFVARDEADTAQQDLANARANLKTTGDQLYDAGLSYDALLEIYGVGDESLKRNENVYPKPADITAKLRAWLMKRAGEITKASEANLQNRKYTVSDATKEVKVIQGETTQVVLYHTTFTEQTVTVQAMLAPLDAQFNFAAKLMEDNNAQFEAASKAYDTRMTEFGNKIDTMGSNYNRDIAEKQSLADQIKNDLDQVRDQVNNLTAQIDTEKSKGANDMANYERQIATLQRQIRALEARIRNEKMVKEIALKEDPKDGEILVASPRKGIVYLNLGRRNRLSAGTRFKVWRPGKGNQREDIAVVLVTKVERTSSEASIIKQIDPRVPVTAGMNVSNPFYDPTKTLRVYIYGDLKQYPTEVARKRLAQSGLQISPVLDDTVNVIILGEPPVTVGDAGMDMDEGEAAAATRRANIERQKRLTEIKDKAESIGALVVTEDVLRTFVEY